MHSWDVLNSVTIQPVGNVSAAFIAAGSLDYRAAAKLVSCLPYRRNSAISDPLVVLRERRGTCSTKHALLRRLALEQGVDVALVVGIYEMRERNTPGVGRVLEKYGLEALPEAHCYLRHEGKRIDITRDREARPLEAIAQFQHEEDIEAEQIGDYKTALHKDFLRRWLVGFGAASGRDLDEIWRIREECIAALGGDREVAALR